MPCCKSIKLILVAALIASCSNATKVPQDQAYGSLNPAFLTSRSNAQVGQEEESPRIREIILAAIRAKMLKIGNYPKKSIANCELLSLKYSNSTHAPASATWNYIATIRINLEAASSHSIQFNVFDRDGEFVVRKISV